MVKQNRGPRYFHGGPAGLAEILPPTRTGVPSAAKFGAAHVCREDRVYITTDEKAAALFGALAPVRGDVVVYEVEPIGEIAPDPDCNEPGLSWECESARIVRVVRTLNSRERALTMLALANGGADR
jgi:rifampin ADP-ribosylating transferase